jgi:prepilin-type N-terminal cleavage/methylation domain-containing protein
MNAGDKDPELSRRERRRGLTLVELVVVLVIIVALASIVIPRADTAAEQGRVDATNATLARLREVILNRYMPDTKGAAFVETTYSGSSGDGTINYDGLPRMGSFNMPPQLVPMFLAPGLSVYNTSSHSGWHGPYIASGTAVFPGANPSTAGARGFLSSASGTSGAFGNANNGSYPGDPTSLDAWGNPIVMVPIYDTTYNQYYYALISAGPSGMLGTVATPGAVAAYGGTQGPYASTQYTSTSGSSIYAVTTPISATIAVDTTGLNGNAPTGARVLTISTTEYYPYWIPLQ